MKRRSYSLGLRAAALALAACAACQTLEELPVGANAMSDAADLGLTLEGCESYSAAWLLAQVAHDLEGYDAAGRPKSAVDDAAYDLQKLYLSRGYASAQVTYQYDDSGDDAPRARFLVQEGPRCELKELRFEGARFFRPSELRPLVKSPTSGTINLTTWFSLEAALDARDALEAVYSEQGFSDVEVSVPEATLAEDRRSATVTYQVEEGQRFLLREVALAGDVLAELDVDQLLEPFTDEPWSGRLRARVISALMDAYARRGYPDCRIRTDSFEADPEGGIHLHLQATAGPQVRIRRIVVRGNERTRTSFIRARLRIEPGELYDRELERAAFAEMYSTGLFRQVTLGLEGEGSERDLVVEVEERPSLEFSVEPGYGSHDRLRLELRLTENDLFGSGRRGRLTLLAAQRALSASIGYSDPWFLDTKILFDTSVFVTQRTEASFDRESYGAAASLTRRWGDHFAATLGYELSTSNADDIEVVDIDPDDEEDLLLSLVRVTPVWDWRDNAFLPSAGSLLRLRGELALSAIGSDIDLVRGTVSWSHYHTLSEKDLLALSMRGGVVSTFNGTGQTPLQERFFLGGADSVRSYREGELGPKDSSGEPYGGEVYGLVSVELRHALVGNLQGTVFLDAASLSEDFPGDLHFAAPDSAVGVGLRWLLPIGPVRLELGVNPDADDDEDDYVLQFNVGSSF